MHYNVISADDHLQEPRDLWTRRLSKAKWGNRIPEVRPYSEGQDAWYIWDQPYINWGYPVLASVMGLMENRRRPLTWDEVPTKSYVPAERIKAMDQDGVDVHTFFGNITGIAGNTFSNPKYSDVDFRLDCIRAYNDFQIDEFAAPYPGRFITLAIVPMWDVTKAVAEAQRMAPVVSRASASRFRNSSTIRTSPTATGIPSGPLSRKPGCRSVFISAVAQAWASTPPLTAATARRFRPQSEQRAPCHPMLT